MDQAVGQMALVNQQEAAILEQAAHQERHRVLHVEKHVIQIVMDIVKEIA